MEGEGVLLEESTLEDIDSAFKVVVRFRSNDIKDKGSVEIGIDGRTIKIRSEESLRKSQTISKRSSLKQGMDLNVMVKTRTFTFDSVSDSSDQEQFYNKYAKQNLIDFMEGMNSSILAYGSTGSGKTFTILGDEEVEKKIMKNKSLESIIEEQAQWGILPCCIETIFEIIKEKRAAGDYCKLKCSYLEIYNEELYDLLSEVQECSKKGVVIQNMIEASIESKKDVFKCLRSGLKMRRMRITQDNIRSSRSHTVFILSLEQILHDKSHVFSKLNIVDLAGSEKFTSNEKLKQKESKNINTSLLSLAKCITHLSTPGQDKKHVPFRESKLTRMLKESFGGNSKTTLICTIRYSELFLSETLRTLRFAREAQKVQNSPLIRIIRDENDKSFEREQQIRDLIEEVIQLKDSNAYLQQQLSMGYSEQHSFKNQRSFQEKMYDKQPILNNQNFETIESDDHYSCNEKIEQVRRHYTLQINRLLEEIHDLKLQVRSQQLHKNEKLEDLQSEMNKLQTKYNTHQREICSFNSIHTFLLLFFQLEEERRELSEIHKALQSNEKKKRKVEAEDEEEGLKGFEFNQNIQIDHLKQEFQQQKSSSPTTEDPSPLFGEIKIRDFPSDYLVEKMEAEKQNVSKMKMRQKELGFGNKVNLKEEEQEDVNQAEDEQEDSLSEKSQDLSGEYEAEADDANIESDDEYDSEEMADEIEDNDLELDDELMNLSQDLIEEQKYLKQLDQRIYKYENQREELSSQISFHDTRVKKFLQLIQMNSYQLNKERQNNNPTSAFNYKSQPFEPKKSILQQHETTLTSKDDQSSQNPSQFEIDLSRIDGSRYDDFDDESSSFMEQKSLNSSRQAGPSSSLYQQQSNQSLESISNKQSLFKDDDEKIIPPKVLGTTSSAPNNYQVQGSNQKKTNLSKLLPDFRELDNSLKKVSIHSPLHHHHNNNNIASDMISNITYSKETKKKLLKSQSDSKMASLESTPQSSKNKQISSYQMKTISATTKKAGKPIENNPQEFKSSDKNASATKISSSTEISNQKTQSARAVGSKLSDKRGSLKSSEVTEFTITPSTTKRENKTFQNSKTIPSRFQVS